MADTLCSSIRKLTGSVLLIGLLLLSAFKWASASPWCQTDDLQNEVCLSEPAQRIVSLSPGATELLFSAGAGESVVAVSAWSDYPPEAAVLPEVGDSQRLDLEAIVALEPDLIVAWSDGNSRQQLGKLASMGFPVFWLQPRRFEDVAAAVERLSQLVDTKLGKSRARNFLEGIRQLEQQYAGKAPVRVFYQIWDQPLMTINDQELIGRAITLCGGQNVFGDADMLVPRVDREAVLAANPEVMLTAGDSDAIERWREQWRPFSQVAAVSRARLFGLTPSLLQRPTLRMLEGTRQLCDAIDRAREP